MSAENVELVRNGYERTNRGEFEAMILEAWHPDVVVDDPSRPDPTTPDGAWRGHEGASRYVNDWEESFLESRQHPEEFTDLGDHVLVRVRTVARGRASGLEVENTRFHVFTVRDARVTRFSVHETEDEARASVRR